MGYVHPGSAPSGVFRISKGAGHVECEVRIDAPKALRGWGLERGVPSQLGEVWGRVGAKPGYCRQSYIILKHMRRNMQGKIPLV